MEKKRVCVTGAGGFAASCLVNLLLSKGFIVHGTVRDPSDEKYAHLKRLENASENLILFKADLLDFVSVVSAVAGCEGVFHVASPVPSSKVPNPEVEVLEPAVTGTKNVLKASLEAKVKRVVMVSSASAIDMKPDWNGTRETVENTTRNVVDVRDLAEALLLVYEKKEASGRHIASSHAINTRDLIGLLKCLFPNYNYPKNIVEVEVGGGKVYSSKKLQLLGWKFRPLEETLKDAVNHYQSAHLLE
ncbi:Cinnamoyl-CoA reductase 1 [Carex littledalei]|uniref:Cinnamoyl-CoA reductase 1 n=1 Tax=Carex littledalei TaxID=544730 RepID=A0A833RAL8_9POAL|nr:Cinnamoyl-CoA reductase 1 [Carex littledalei]